MYLCEERFNQSPRRGADGPCSFQRVVNKGVATEIRAGTGQSASMAWVNSESLPVPKLLALAILVPSPLDLVGGSGSPKFEIFGKISVA